MDRWTGIQGDGGHVYRWTGGRWTRIQVDRWTGEQVERRTCGHADRLTGDQVDMCKGGLRNEQDWGKVEVKSYLDNDLT